VKRPDLTRIKRRLRRRARGLRRRYLNSAGISVKPDLRGDARTLLVTFGGLGALGRGPGFEFETTARTLPVKRLFVTDPEQAWYHRGGAPGAAIADVAHSISELLAGREVERLVTIGNSAGGYAALIFGTLLAADAVISFAPQTVLDPEVLAKMGDHRWDGLLLPLAARGALEEQWLDLRTALPPRRRRDTRYKVYFDETIVWDRLHAERLRELEGVRFYRFGRGGHRLVRGLRDSGALTRLLTETLEL
jgi:hypothetical protein